MSNNASWNTTFGVNGLLMRNSNNKYFARWSVLAVNNSEGSELNLCGYLCQIFFLIINIE